MDKGGKFVVRDVYVHIGGIPAIAADEIAERKGARDYSPMVSKGIAESRDVADERLHELPKPVTED